MVVLIILCIISVILNIAIYPLCKINYRDEDLEKIAEGKLRIISETKHFPQACWVLSIIFLIAAFFVRNNLVEVVIMIGIQGLVALFLCIYAAFYHNSYYTIDEERLVHVKHGIEEWKHTWDEIDHARRRIVSTGKTFIIYYDITTKEGVKHRSLPASLGRELKQRVPLDKSVNPWLIILLAVLIVIVGILIALGWASKH